MAVTTPPSPDTPPPPPAPPAASDPEGQAQRELRVTAQLLGVALIVAVATVLAARVDRLGPALVWCFGCLVSGFVVGFLFGFPRVVTEDRPSGRDGAEAGPRGLAHRLGVNTNLEQVSDWLTKIIVGVGLVELKNVPTNIRRAGDYIGAGFGDTAAALVFQQRLAAGIVVSFGGLGLLSGYLLTRMFFSAAFRRADFGTLGIGDEQRRVLATAPLEREGRKVQLPEASKAVSERLVRVSQESVAGSAEELAAWSRVQFEAGQYENAISGYRDAVAKAPWDARLRHAYAIALKYGRRPPADYMPQLEQARQLARSSADVSLRREVYASYTFNALYLDPPEGFVRARDAALEYINAPDHAPSGDILLNLACSYGQEYQYRQKANTDDPLLQNLRDGALQALKEALVVDPRLIPRAQQLVDGRSAEDDDLVAFKNDNDFRQAVGLPPVP